MTEVAISPSAASEKRFAAVLQHRFFLRVHMTAMLALTLLAGIFTVRFLNAIGVSILFFRYAIAVIVAYAVFVSSVKLWLWYIGIVAAAAAARKTRSSSDWFDAFNISGRGGSSIGSSSGSSAGSAEFGGGGGRFGGGGATGSWGDARTQPSFMTFLSSKGSSGGGGGDSDSDLGELILIVLAIAVVLAVLASFVWVIWAAPTILSEAAFNAVLAGALAKHANKASHGSWIGSVIRATAVPFAIILVLAVLLGWYAQHYCPDATSLREAIHCARPAS